MYGVAHEPWIVVLSILVAIQGCYVALGLALKVAGSEGLPHRLNLAAAATTFAVSIWSMHFVGMLAVRVPFRLDYLVLPTLLSFLVCAFVVGGAVLVASYAPGRRFAVPVAGLLMGIGIVTMHYIGMLALHHSAAMYHDPVFVAASFAVAIIASTLGLRFAFLPRRGLPVALAAALFGLAISGMHYIAMAGMRLTPVDEHGGLPTGAEAAISPNLLAVIVTIVAFLVSAVFLLMLVPDHGPSVAVTTPETALPPDPPTPVAEVARAPARVLPVERGGATHYVPVEAIVLVQADAHYTTVFDGRTRSFCALSIGEVEARLDASRFLRVHRSYIVALDHVACVRRAGDSGTAQIDAPDPVTVPVSRARYPKLKARIGARA